MTTIDISKGYLYLPEYNIIINDAFLETFKKYGNEKKVITRDIQLDEKTIISNISNVGQLTFEVTQDCNLKCKYCPYSGGFKYERKKKKLDMTLDVAQKSIDYFADLFKSRVNESLTIAFYGGEPLLKFDTIKAIVHYALKKMTGLKLNFTMTSNATICNDEILSFLIRHDFYLVISLDGPKENHDAKRVFENNTGSFNSVWKFIEQLHKKDIDYYRNKVTFSTIYTHDLSLKKVFDFFLNNNVVNSNRIRLGSANTQNSNYDIKYPDHYVDAKIEYQEILDSILDNMTHNKLLRPIEKEFGKSFGNELISKEYTTLAGACSFSSKLYIDCTGNFHICEKINSSLPFGNYVNGIDLHKLSLILRDYRKLIRKYCLECSYKILCSPCYVNFAVDGSFAMDEKYCDKRKRVLKKNLREYVAIKTGSISDSNKLKDNLVKKFHQFITVEKGPRNTAILDFLRGEIYHSSNEEMDLFLQGDYTKIEEFLNVATKEELILEVPPYTWIPYKEFNPLYLPFADAISGSRNINLEIEEGANLKEVYEYMFELNIKTVSYYGNENLDLNPLFGDSIIYKRKNFDSCILASTVREGNFENCNETVYSFNKHCNSCWGYKIAVSGDGNIRPCIYSGIVVGNISIHSLKEILYNLKKYWFITKDKVEKCKNCEFRYVCFDCREIAFREGNSIYAPNPTCKYEPTNGTWNK